MDEAVDEGRLGRLADLGLGGAGIAVGDVLPDGAAEEPGVLEDHADLRPQLGTGHLGGVDTVEQDPPAVQGIEAHDEVDQRGLAGAGRPDDGHRLARLGLE